VSERRTLRDKQGLEICDGLAKLLAYTVKEFAFVYTKLSGADDPIARSNDRPIWTRRYGKWIPRSRGISDRSS